LVVWVAWAIADAIGTPITRVEMDAAASAALAASGIEEMRGALEAAADMCAVYADFIRNHVCADDIEIHPYLPALEDVIANGRAALSLADGMGGEG
jgi:hypothetical protein